MKDAFFTEGTIVGNVGLLKIDAIRKLDIFFICFGGVFMILFILKHFIGPSSQSEDLLL